MHRLRKQISLVISSAFLLSGCVAQVATHDQPSYLLSVKFYSQPCFTNTTRSLEVVARSGIPFAAQMQDENTNFYRCSGTLQARPQGMVHWDQFRINYPRVSAGPGSFDLKLGEEYFVFMVATVLQDAYSYKVTRQ